MSYFSEKEPIELKGHLKFPLVLVSVVFFLLAGRFLYLQVIEQSYFKELSENNSLRLIKAVAPRGNILDRTGIRLAENRPGFDLIIVPEDVKDWEKTKKTINGLVEIDQTVLEERLKKAKDHPAFEPVKLKDDLTWNEMVGVETQGLRVPGLLLEVSPKRIYPFGDIVAHLIGYMGEVDALELERFRDYGLFYRQKDLTGKYGIEKTFDHMLRGRDGGQYAEVNVLGRKVRVLKSVPPYPGNNLRLTIDIETQITAHTAMKERAGAVVAIDPRDGRLIAMVSTPSFDPNILSSGITRKEWEKLITNPMKALSNRAIQGLYPPASTFKLITAAAALEEKVITAESIIHSGPVFHYADRDYRDWKEEGHGDINVHRAIVESADTFFYQAGLRVGVDNIALYAKRFGLGTKTGVALYNEKTGIVPSSEWKKKTLGAQWYSGETLSVAVGQGFAATTPMQMLIAYSAIANGGTLYIPKIIEEVKTPDGDIITGFDPEKKARLLVSKETLDILKKALRGVVAENGGTAGMLRLENIAIAGKTGTAQVAVLKERTKDVAGIPYELRDHAWFVGFAPYEDPSIAVVVLVEHGGFGASAAAPVALEVIKAYLLQNGNTGQTNVRQTAYTAH
ncbi:MAG: penicillin-binding protein 2 [Deltaproteobacteria bacterium]|nr:penicillin-binding protein 2 [Deltaproteobacteria bacterium]